MAKMDSRIREYIFDVDTSKRVTTFVNQGTGEDKTVPGHESDWDAIMEQWAKPKQRNHIFGGADLNTDKPAGGYYLIPTKNIFSQSD